MTEPRRLQGTVEAGRCPPARRLSDAHSGNEHSGSTPGGRTGSGGRPGGVTIVRRAAVAAENELLDEDAGALAAGLEVALRSRAVIDQAKGMVMERFWLTAHHAVAALAQVSGESNPKVYDVAERFVETVSRGLLPVR